MTDSLSDIVGPSSITTGPDGALWFTESNNSIGRITTAGTTTSFTDPSISSPAGIAAGPDGALWFTNFNTSSIGRITTDGDVTDTFTDPTIASPLGITAGPDGALWFINAGGVNTSGVKTHGSIGRIDTNGTVTRYVDQSISSPVSIAAGADGALWFTNFGGNSNGSIGRITTAGVVTNYTDPSIVHPISITSSACNGNALWYTQGNDSLGFLDPTGPTIFSITAPSVSAPNGITATDTGCNVWFTNQLNNSVGHVYPGAAPGSWVFDHFTSASISAPVGIAAGSDGAFWFTSFTNNSIGRITTSGALSRETHGPASSTPPPVPFSGPSATPSARVGVFYFDGWGGPLTNYHFFGVARPGAVGGPPNGQFPDRQPLNGWQDDTVETMRTQLAWARQAGIGFFNFLWYNYDDPPEDPINGALRNYMQLTDHNGVGFALTYVAQGQFGVPLDQLPAVADNWVTQYMLNPDYERINGKPLLTILEILDTVNLWGDTDGINQGLQIIQDAAIAHGLPGVYIVGLRSDYQEYCEGVVLDCLEQNGQQSQQHWDGISQFSISQSVTPVDGPTPYSRVVNEEEQVHWPAWAQQTTFPYIPSVGVGYDARAWNAQINDSNSLTHLFWFERDPSDVGEFLADAIYIADQNPQLHVESADGRPVVFLQSWNELAEGAWLVPTVGDGYAYAQALATALGIPFETTHPRQFTSINTTATQVTGTLAVDDNWSPCDVDAVLLQRLTNATWVTVGFAETQPGGSFTMAIPATPGRHRVRVAQSTKYLQTCKPAATTIETVPGPPASVKATSGSTTAATGSLTVTYTAPVINGGSAVSGYTATCTSSNGGATKTGTHMGANAAPIAVAAVTTGKTYRCRVKATNAIGNSVASAASPAVIVGSPAPPTAVVATKTTSGTLRVTFTIGANNGNAIQSQIATCTSSNGGVTKSATHAGAAAAPINVIGLTGGKTYTCKVRAKNARGIGLASAASAAKTA